MTNPAISEAVNELMQQFSKSDAAAYVALKSEINKKYDERKGDVYINLFRNQRGKLVMTGDKHLNPNAVLSFNNRRSPDKSLNTEVILKSLLSDDDFKTLIDSINRQNDTIPDETFDFYKEQERERLIHKLV